MNGQQEPIETYLDELLVRLRLPARETRRSLAETESHLREASEGFEARGMNRQQAERIAIENFGRPSDLAEAEAAVCRPSLSKTLIAAGQAILLLLSGGLLAIGISGALAAVFNWVSGPQFVGALHETYSTAVCRHFLLAHQTARSCAQAAISENSYDAVVLRLLAGAVGAAGLCAAAAWRRFNPPGGRLQAIDAVTAGVAAAAFGLAALAMAGQSLDLLVQHGSGGVGWWLSGAVVAALACCPCAAVAYRRTRSALRMGLLSTGPAYSHGQSSF